MDGWTCDCVGIWINRLNRWMDLFVFGVGVDGWMDEHLNIYINM